MNVEKNGVKTIDEYIAQFPFALHGNLVHFAAFENHIGFYPTPSAIEKFKDELSSYKGAKGSVQFPINKQLPYELIRRIVDFRVNENKKKKM
jgi:uncharacterized protein YdhG (YjbR/CyaY superfamily)